jgi:hypothetical protein
MSSSFKPISNFSDGGIKLGVLVPGTCCWNSFILTGDGEAYWGLLCSVRGLMEKFEIDVLDYGVCT